MKIIYNKIFLEHDTGMHPENKSRLESLGELKETDLSGSEELAHLIHTKKYIERVQKLSKDGSSLDGDTLTSPKSYKVSMKAIEATVLASESNDLAIVRPPGHHAHRDKGTGFCLFNNVAIATQRLIDQGKRVMILDFDGHFGDGTEAIFYESDQVLYWSLHQYPAFPFKGNVNEIGEGLGRGYSINVPLPPGSADDIFEKAVNRFLPVARQYNPDIVAVSAGFDGHQYDPLLDLRFSVNSFYWIGQLLNKEFKSVFATLEGGYNLEYLPKCVFNFIAGVNGEPQRFEELPTESKMSLIEEYELRADHLEKNLSDFWKLN